MAEMLIITEAQEKILLALAKFKYLTPTQMIALGFGNDQRRINKKLRTLHQKGYIDHHSFPVVTKKGRIENVHFLTKKGKKLLVESRILQDNEVRMPIGTSTMFHKDYYHRKWTIDFHINIDRWCEDTGSFIVYFDTYFDKTGENRTTASLRSKTRIDLPDNSFLIPDSIFLLDFPNGNRELYLFEMCNGKNTLRTIKQIKQHAQAIAEGSINESLGHKKPYYVLHLFEERTHMEAVMQRLANDAFFVHTIKHFCFKTHTDLANQPFPEGWVDAFGEKRSIT